jgi:hypothetical protein
MQDENAAGFFVDPVPFVPSPLCDELVVVVATAATRGVAGLLPQPAATSPRAARAASAKNAAVQRRGGPACERRAWKGCMIETPSPSSALGMRYVRAF